MNERPTFDALEDFAGPGGWDEGAKLIGLRFYGVDYDGPACETARAAGHHREQADVTEHASPEWARGRGVVSSPSCTLFSMAGSGIGRLVIDVLCDAVKSILTGSDPVAVRDMARGAIYPVAFAETEAKNVKRKPEKRWPTEKVEAKARLDAKIAALVLEPARRIMEGEPEWLALEQVPEVMPVWHAYQTVLGNQGWSVWTGVMNAADYGVPQTRRRAILIASRVRQVAPPTPTHAEHPQDVDLFGNALKKWVCMVLFGHRSNDVRWVFDRPATTVVGSFKPEVIAAPSYRTQESRQDAPGSVSVSVSVSEAGVLQSFRADYPWQGSKSKQYEQVGNAIPPLLAAHVLSAVTGIPLQVEAAA